MGLFAEFDVVDDFGFAGETPEYGIVPDYEEGCSIFASTFIDQATSMVPVDTGYLRATLTADGSDTYCYAETDCDYAQYPEYGTWCQGAQPYFEPALEIAISAAAPAWHRAEAKAFEEERQLIIAEMEAEAEMQEAEQRASMQSSADPNNPANNGQGQLNFSSPSAFFGSLFALFLVAVIVVTAKEIFSYDQGTPGKNHYPLSGDYGDGSGDGAIFIPEVIIT